MTEKRAKPDQFQLRMPPGLRDRIKVYAERHGRSMNEEIVRLLEREFPEPWTVDGRVSDLLRMLRIIRSGASDERLSKLTSELEDTVFGLMTGRVGGLDEKAMADMNWSWENYCEERMEDDRHLLNLDEEEEEQLEISGTTAKFVDISEPARLERVKSFFPELKEEHLKQVSSALVSGNAESVLETIGDVIRRQKHEAQKASKSSKLDEDIPF